MRLLAMRTVVGKVLRKVKRYGLEYKYTILLFQGDCEDLLFVISLRLLFQYIFPVHPTSRPASR
jgi:hypothetical protein